MRLILLLLSLFLSFGAMAQVFKCANSRVSYSDSPCSSGGVSYNASAASVSTPVSLQIVHANGGFFYQGSANGLPVNFQIDTGATKTTLSGDTAFKLGVKSCVPSGVSHTANGQAVFCMVRLSSLTLGQFTFSNVDVQVMPGMSGVSLFGMDLLSQMHFSQFNGVLTISR